jgi:precorrin-3B methylase
MARELVLIGIGAGNTDWVSLAAVKAIQELDVLFVVIKEKELDEFVEVRRRIVAEHRERPLRTVGAARSAPALAQHPRLPGGGSHLAGAAAAPVGGRRRRRAGRGPDRRVPGVGGPVPL